MSGKQTIIWTALPNGSDGPNAGGTTLRLSVFASPRLWNDDKSVATMQLSELPDFLDWPNIIGDPAVSFDVSFNGGAAINVKAKTPPRSDIWKALFKNETIVVPFKFQNMAPVPVINFPAWTIHDTIKDVFQTVATDPKYGAGTDLPPRDVLGDDPTFGEIAIPTDPPKDYVPIPVDDKPVFVGSKEPEPDSPLPSPEPKPAPAPAPSGCGCGCLALPLALLRRFLKWIGLVATLPFTMSGIGGGVGGGAPKGAAAGAALGKGEAFQQLNQYIQPINKIAQPLPTADDLKKTYDFHQMIATLGDYPKLLRYFGLVIDLEIELPAAIGANGTVTVTPKDLPLAPGLETTPYTPRTHYSIDNEKFVAQPGPSSDLRDGLLRVDDTTRFRVLQLDVAGGGTKLQNTATTVVHHRKYNRWAGNAPKEQGLPSLQTAGISIARADAAEHLKDRFLNSWALDVALRVVDKSSDVEDDAPPPKQDLFAEDLVRGYRVDVWDDKSNAWHSLCRRVGTYTFAEAEGGSLQLKDEEDEGFVQMSVTEPVPGAGPRVLRTHDSLFTWNGWSLGAPRYGNTIEESDAHDPDSTKVGKPSNAPATQFKMETAFTPKAKSLPRLRFGYTYQLRVRATDLAGNSVFSPDDAAFGVAQTEVTEKVKYRRFEPVSPPMVMLQAKPVEGESLERLVVRSKFDDAAADINKQQTARHIVPPKTSQLMAEHHRKFDGSPAMKVADHALAQREAGSLTHDIVLDSDVRVPIPGATEIIEPPHSFWIQANDTFAVTYLPDPYARGVLLLGLPGMDPSDKIVEPDVDPIVNKIPFDPWPNPKPFRLRVTGIKAKVKPATPVWDGMNHVLDVQIPQGETYEVQISSYFHDNDLKNMAVWAWTEEKPVPNLNELRTRAVEGRNWLHLPFRTLVLVHAVQQPLEIPQFDSITPHKNFGDTIATLEGKLRVDAKSTSKVDVRAEWQDPFDDVTKPAFVEATDFTTHKMQLAEWRVLDPTNDLPEFTPLKHPVGDTKYHAVTYTPSASTRFREYFPESVTAEPKNLVRPTDAEAGIPSTVDILNSARPDKPKPLYMVPLFEWTRGGAPLTPKAVRRCGGLRVYLERPWFSTGAGELLGVTLKPPSVPFGSEEAEALKKFTSEWGMDPLWPADATFPLLTPNFRTPPVPPMSVQLEETGKSVDVVGYAPQFDATRNLWYCDILLDPGTAYFPMVRLVLARFQPKSVAPAHISTTVPADFIQLVPHREVGYDLRKADTTGEVEVVVIGPAYEFGQEGQFSTSQMIVRLERRTGDGTSDEIGWERVASSALTPTTFKPENTVWQGQVRTSMPRPTPMRVVVLEVEVYGRDTDRAEIVDALNLLDDLPESFGEGSTVIGFGYRITFADAVELA